MAGLADVMAALSQSDTVKQLGQKLGVDPSTVGRGIAAAVPLLMAALANNASTPTGAQALHQAVTSDHDGSILDDLKGALQNADTASGGRILGHLLGDRQTAAEQAIARGTGLNAQAASQVLATLAPIAMGAVARLQQEHGLDAQGLSSRLQQEVEMAKQRAPGLMSLATRLLDRNQDGSMLDDVGNMVGKLFKTS
jgi:hypothetical protein